MSKHNLLKRLGLQHPIIQAPMAGTATPALAAAVSNAGGLGSISIANFDAPTARKNIQALKALTDRPYNINVFVHEEGVADAAREAQWVDFLRPEFERYGAQPPAALKNIMPTFYDNEAVVQVLVEERPPVVSFHFGLPPATTITALKNAGAVLLATATSVAEARLLEAAGIDAIVAQGIEAGGHRGVMDPAAPDDELTTAALTRLLATHTALPVIAAGGIMDGAGVAAYLELGAELAQLGTAFIACPESAADEGFRATLASDAAFHTRLTPIVSGRAARSLATNWVALDQGTHALGPHPPQPAYPIAYDAAKALIAAAKAKGDNGWGAYWAGQGAPLSRGKVPAAELLGQLVAELAAARKASAAKL
ncbi:hypothetical protein Q8F55_009263 [Vanrija albida]|uniref:Nitronate monooxygenase domain-containing protein n=1 Tax=Vanrija albida TaxID=181172 RepID=A0ABR3PT62_9TREE